MSRASTIAARPTPHPSRATLTPQLPLSTLQRGTPSQELIAKSRRFRPIVLSKRPTRARRSAWTSACAARTPTSSSCRWNSPTFASTRWNILLRVWGGAFPRLKRLTTVNYPAWHFAGLSFNSESQGRSTCFVGHGRDKRPLRETTITNLDPTAHNQQSAISRTGSPQLRKRREPARTHDRSGGIHRDTRRTLTLYLIGPISTGKRHRRPKQCLVDSPGAGALRERRLPAN